MQVLFVLCTLFIQSFGVVTVLFVVANVRMVSAEIIAKSLPLFVIQIHVLSGKFV